jgi:hypothetical protein
MLGEHGWLTPSPDRFTPRNDPVSIAQDVELAPEPVWTGAKISPLPGFDPRTGQPLASRSAYYDISLF